jgi:hypothetical protein
VDTGRACSPLAEERFTVETPSSPAGGVSLSENLLVNNSLLPSMYNVPASSSSSTSPTLSNFQRLSTAQPPPVLQTISTTANSAISFAMASSANDTAAIFDDVQQDTLGDIDQSIPDNTQVDLGEIDQTDLGDNNELILGDTDTSTNERKRGVDETENGTISTETAAKKSKTIEIKRRNVAELGSDPVSPSPPAGKKGKGKGKATKAAVPKKKKKKKAVDDGGDESPIVGKKPMTKSALRKAELASKEVLAISIESDNGNESLILDANGVQMTKAAMMKRGIGPYAVGAARIPNAKSSGASEGVKARWGPLPTQASGGGHKRARHAPAAARAYYDIEEEEEYEDDVEDYPQAAKYSRQYSQHELGMSDIPLYTPTASYYQSPYGIPPHMQNQNNPYSRSYLAHPAYPQYDPHAMALGPHQMPILNRGATSFNKPHQPGPAVFHPFGVATTTDRPASSHSNRPASVHSNQVGADPSNPAADEAQRSPRPLGRIYVDGGHEVMTETCPCCRRGFD